jgi:hypothetical protein
MAEPSLHEGGDGCGFIEPALHRNVILRRCEGSEPGDGVRCTHGDKQAGRCEAEGRRLKCGRGHAGEVRVESGGIRDRERNRKAVDERDGGRGAVGKLDGEAQAETRGHQGKLVASNFVEETRAIAENDRDAGHRIPGHVAEAAEAGEVGGDFIPVGMEGDRAGRAESKQALC